MKTTDAAQEWQELCGKRDFQELPFETQKAEFEKIYRNWNVEKSGPRPAWIPDEKKTNLHHAMEKIGITDFDAFYHRSIVDRQAHWLDALRQVGIRFQIQPKAAFLKKAPGQYEWLPGSQLNIVESCFQGDLSRVAITHRGETGRTEQWTYAELLSKTHQIAQAIKKEFGANHPRIAILMPMTAESIAIYLGILWAGGTVVAIADSFSPPEIEIRLRIAKAELIFIQENILRGAKAIPLYARLFDIQAPKAIVLGATHFSPARPADESYDAFLKKGAPGTCPAEICPPSQEIGILFSSGTTGEPKAIPWDHSTAIKAIVDGHFHQDIQPQDVVCWPTNLGWMMGPWLIFAALGNRASIALFVGSPLVREFGEFVRDANVTVLGVVPSIVRHWKESDCMKGLKWNLKLFSSTGECSNPDDYFFLMSLGKFRPVIEYCGGTEIGGAYITGTLLQPAAPGTFTTPALGTEMVILNEDGEPAEMGEAFLVPPAMGLSERLLNRDHLATYFEGCPSWKGGKLRRHGDAVERLPAGYFRALGRADDTMNLGGIKVSSAELENAIGTVDGVLEAAAVAVDPPGGGPSHLVVFAKVRDKLASDLQNRIQKAINQTLNPLFKIHDLVLVEALPRTASNKVLRRELRKTYMAKQK